MLIERRYRFYAAHRNLGLGGKCARLHGHRYGIAVKVKVARGKHGVGIAFEEIDALLAPVFAAFDHRTLLHCDDPLAISGTIEGAVILPFEPSTERIAVQLLAMCCQVLDECVSIEVTETDSATVVATQEDFAVWLTP
jgi:6-pyruvoyltetrahydropterin/6-carboxytetrahydropterin synthase